jgi:hypothetical protein
VLRPCSVRHAKGLASAQVEIALPSHNRLGPSARPHEPARSAPRLRDASHGNGTAQNRRMAAQINPVGVLAPHAQAWVTCSVFLARPYYHDSFSV